MEYPAVKPLDKDVKEEIIERVKILGVVGMGGAGFPTFYQTFSEETGENRLCYCKLCGMRDPI